MSDLNKFLLRHAAIGFGVAFLVVGLILWTDLAGLRTLILGSEVGLLALGILTFFMGLTFGSAQMGFAIMSRGDGEGGGRRDRRFALPRLRPARAAAYVPRQPLAR